jgi:hypothetical protein
MDGSSLAKLLPLTPTSRPRGHLHHPSTSSPGLSTVHLHTSLSRRDSGGQPLSCLPLAILGAPSVPQLELNGQKKKKNIDDARHRTTTASSSMGCIIVLLLLVPLLVLPVLIVSALHHVLAPALT